MKAVDFKVFESKKALTMSSGEKISEVDFELLVRRTRNFTAFMEKLEELFDKEFTEEDRRVIKNKYEETIG